MAAMTPEQRETDHLGAGSTAMHNATTRPVQTATGLMSSLNPLAWGASDVSGMAMGQHAMNPFTSRRVKITNAGGYLPWG